MSYDFTTLVTAVDTKARTLAASSTDPKDLVFIGKAIEAMTPSSSVSAVVAQGTTSVAAVASQQTTSIAAVTAARTSATTALNAIAFTTGTVTAVSKTLANSEHVIVTAATKTMTLPSGTAGGSKVTISTSGTFVDTVVTPASGQKIMSQAADESMTIDRANAFVRFEYHSDAHGWRIS